MTSTSTSARFYVIADLEKHSKGSLFCPVFHQGSTSIKHFFFNRQPVPEGWKTGGFAAISNANVSDKSIGFTPKSKVS
jgi:hypothetical protein